MRDGSMDFRFWILNFRFSDFGSRISVIDFY